MPKKLKKHGVSDSLVDIQHNYFHLRKFSHHIFFNRELPDKTWQSSGILRKDSSRTREPEFFRSNIYLKNLPCSNIRGWHFQHWKDFCGRLLFASIFFENVNMMTLYLIFSIFLIRFNIIISQISYYVIRKLICFKRINCKKLYLI